jgi:hypothetical protein
VYIYTVDDRVVLGRVVVLWAVVRRGKGLFMYVRFN